MRVFPIIFSIYAYLLIYDPCYFTSLLVWLSVNMWNETLMFTGCNYIILNGKPSCALYWNILLFIILNGKIKLWIILDILLYYDDY